ncbi:hypothetical protein OAJ07_01120 [Gemmatimonadales bacterium]|nr:hypothetical protein [Gemmatimonadales bacterium]
MSESGTNDNTVEVEAFGRLESAIARLARAVEDADLRATSAEAQMQALQTKNSEMAGLMERFTESPSDAEHLMSRLKGLEAENGDLKSRLDRGREGVERMIARIRFLENQG